MGIPVKSSRSRSLNAKNIQSTEKEISVKGTDNNAKVFELSCWQSQKMLWRIPPPKKNLKNLPKNREDVKFTELIYTQQSDYSRDKTWKAQNSKGETAVSGLSPSSATQCLCNQFVWQVETKTIGEFKTWLTCVVHAHLEHQSQLLPQDIVN